VYQHRFLFADEFVHENLCAEELSLHGTHLVRVHGTEVGGVTSTCDAYMEKYKKTSVKKPNILDYN
jgi:hypothetical protein